MVFGRSHAWYGNPRCQDSTDDNLITANWISVPGHKAGCVSCKNHTACARGMSTTIAPSRPVVTVTTGQHRVAIIGWLYGDAVGNAPVLMLATRSVCGRKPGSSIFTSTSLVPTNGRRRLRRWIHITRRVSTW